MATFPTVPAACRPMPQTINASSATMTTATTTATMRAEVAPRSGWAGGSAIVGGVSVVVTVVRKRYHERRRVQGRISYAIRPWRTAMTAAWVRSLTPSFWMMWTT